MDADNSHLIDWSKLSMEELQSIIDERPCSTPSQLLFAHAIKHGGIDMLKEEAEGGLWRRRIASLEVLSDSDVQELLSKKPHSTARKLLGEAATMNRLTDAQLELVLLNTVEDRYIQKQAKARQLSLLVKQAIAANDSIAERNLLDNLCNLGLAWPIVELVGVLDSDTLEYIVDGLERHPFSRSDRHSIRTAVQKMTKGRSQ
jgi:hypothetical protein